MKSSYSFITPLYTLLILFVSACTSNEIGESKDVAPETVYQQYSVSFREGDRNATVYAQFRFAGDDGTTLVLTKPGNIQLDGVEIPVDSSEFEGAFYKKSVPVGNLQDEHILKFTGFDKRNYENKFSLDIFKLTNLPETSERTQPIAIQFEPLQLGPDDRIELHSVDSDSSFTVSYTAADSTSLLCIPVAELQRQKGNQLKIEATFHRHIPLQQGTAEGGKLGIEYVSKPFIINLQ